MLKKTSWWVCDTCGEIISRASEGYLEWIKLVADNGRKGRGIRIVHHAPFSPLKGQGGCQYDEKYEMSQDGGFVADTALEKYTSEDGLTYLLSIMDSYDMPKKEMIQIIQRIITPGYEEARLSVDQAIERGIIEPNLPAGFLTQSDIEMLIENSR